MANVTLPTYQRQVQSRPGTQFRKNAQSPDGIFGDPVGQAKNQFVSKVAGAASDLMQSEFAKAKQRADGAKLLEVNNRAAKLEIDLQVETSKLRGKDAFGANEMVDKRWKELETLVEQETAYDSDVRSRALERLQTGRLSLGRYVEGHAAKEAEMVHMDELDASIMLAQNGAALNANNSEAWSEKMNVIRASSEEIARTRGLDANATAALVLKNESAAHRAIINKKMNTGFIQEAKAHLIANQAEMLPQDREAVMDNIKRATDEAMAEDAATEATGKFKTMTQVDAFLKGKGLDPFVLKRAKDIANEKLDQGIKDKKRIHEDLYLKAKTLMQQQGLNAVMKNYPDLIKAMDPDHVEALTKTHNALQKPLDQKNDNWKFTQFNDLSVGQLRSMTPVDLETKWLSNFDEKHREKALGMFNAAKKGGAENATVTTFKEYKGDFQNILTQSGFDIKSKLKTKKGRDDYAKIELAIQEAVENFEVNKLGGKKATPSEIRDVIKTQLFNRYIDQNWASDPKATPLFMNEEQRSKSYYQIKDVPDSFITESREYARGRGKALTDYQIGQLYAARLDGDKARRDAIMAGADALVEEERTPQAKPEGSPEAQDSGTSTEYRVRPGLGLGQ